MEQKQSHLPKYNVGVHFLTAKTFRNTPYFSDPIYARILCLELEAARATYSFHILAFVVMPDHIHLLLWWDTEALPDLTISKIAWAVKGLSARRIADYLKGIAHRGVADGIAADYYPLLQPARVPVDRPHHRNWRYKIWQQGAGYDFNIYTEHKLLEKITYIHANPVRAGLVTAPEDYAWSSAANYAQIGFRVDEGNALIYPEPHHPIQVTPYTEIWQ